MPEGIDALELRRAAVKLATYEEVELEAIQYKRSVEQYRKMMAQVGVWVGTLMIVLYARVAKRAISVVASCS